MGGSIFLMGQKPQRNKRNSAAHLQKSSAEISSSDAELYECEKGKHANNQRFKTIYSRSICVCRYAVYYGDVINYYSLVCSPYLHLSSYSDAAFVPGSVFSILDVLAIWSK